MDSYLHQSRGCDSPSDSEHESSEENVVGAVVKHQQMFIWNTEYEVRVPVFPCVSVPWEPQVRVEVAFS